LEFFFRNFIIEAVVFPIIVKQSTVLPRHKCSRSITTSLLKSGVSYRRIIVFPSFFTTIVLL